MRITEALDQLLRARVDREKPAAGGTAAAAKAEERPLPEWVRRAQERSGQAKDGTVPEEAAPAPIDQSPENVEPDIEAVAVEAVAVEAAAADLVVKPEPPVEAVQHAAPDTSAPEPEQPVVEIVEEPALPAAAAVEEPRTADPAEPVAEPVLVAAAAVMEPPAAEPDPDLAETRTVVLEAAGSPIPAARPDTAVDLARLEAVTVAAERLDLGYHLGAAVERIASAARQGSEGVAPLRQAAWLIDRYAALLEQRPIGADLHLSGSRLARAGADIEALRALAASLGDAAAGRDGRPE